MLLPQMVKTSQTFIVLTTGAAPTTATSLLLYRVVAVMKLPVKMLPMLLLPCCNCVEVDCENATYAADTHMNVLLLPTRLRVCFCFRWSRCRLIVM